MPVATDATKGAIRFQQQALALVEPDGFHVDPGRLGEGADGKGVPFGFHALDSVLDYGNTLPYRLQARKENPMSEPLSINALKQRLAARSHKK